MNVINILSRNTALILFSIILFCTPQSKSQGHLLQKDESALRILTYYLTGNDFAGYGIGTDYNYRGIVSLGLLTYNGSYNNGNSTDKTTGIFIGAYPIKATSSSPISIQFGVGYYNNSFEDQELDTLYFDFRQSQFEIFAGVNYHFFINDKFVIVPGSVYKHIIFSADAVNFRGTSLKGKSRFSFLIFSTDFAFLFSHKIILNLSPGLSVGVEGDDNSDVSFNIDINVNIIL